MDNSSFRLALVESRLANQTRAELKLVIQIFQLWESNFLFQKKKDGETVSPIADIKLIPRSAIIHLNGKGEEKDRPGV